FSSILSRGPLPLKYSLRSLSVLCVSAVVECARPIFNAETQRTRREHRESLRFTKLSVVRKQRLRSENLYERSGNTRRLSRNRFRLVAIKFEDHRVLAAAL